MRAVLRIQLLAVMRNEWRYLGSQRVAWVMGVLLMAALLVALITAWTQHERQLALQSSFQTLVDRQWTEQPDRHPHRVAHFGTFAFRMPAALGFFDPGVDRYVGNSLFLEAHRQNPANFAAAGQASSLSRFPSPSPAFLLQTLLPLLLIIVAGLSMTREHEQRTVVQLRAQGLPLSVMLTGKALAYWIAGCGAVILIALAALPLVSLAQAGQALAIVSATVALTGVYALYVWIWVMLALLVSARCTDSRQALAVLCAIWLLLALVLPRVLPFWAAGGEGESRIAFNAALEADLRSQGDSHDTADARFNAFRDKVLNDYGVDRVEDLPVNFGGLLMQEGERRTSEVFAKHYEQLQARWDRQEKRLTWLAALNPVLAVQQASAALSGTDRAAFRHFETQAEAYRYAFIQELNHVHVHQIAFENDRGQRVSNANWHAIAPFVYQPEPLVDRLLRAAPASLLLLLWSLVPLGLVRRVTETRG
jgi:ABC-2 type transport system permease protein